MVETRTCAVCAREVPTNEWCAACVTRIEEAPKEDSRPPAVRADELRLWIEGAMTVPFDILHGHAEKLVGRPVWTHEFANPKALYKEILSGKGATLEDVFGKLPADKPVVFLGVPKPDSVEKEDKPTVGMRRN